jgi:maleylpyruvate isomerase
VVVDGEGVWVLDGGQASIGRLVEELSASHRRLEAIASQIAEGGLVCDTRLAGWTNAHLLCHLERNAASHLRMLVAAMTGQLVEQYPGGDGGRRAEIDAGSRRSLDALATELAATNRRLEAQWAVMEPASWHNPTRARAGTRPAYSCLWARWREVEIHIVDLDSGVEVRDWLTDFAVAGLDVSFQGLELRSVTDRLPAGVRLELHDGTVACWRTHRDSEPTHVGEGSTQLLPGWVVGRSERHHVTWSTGPPALETWP